jgi:hypothetical protein
MMIIIDIYVYEEAKTQILATKKKKLRYLLEILYIIKLCYIRIICLRNKIKQKKMIGKLDEKNEIASNQN